MIKILHTADIHLDSPLRSLAMREPELREQVRVATRAALVRIVDIALEEGVAALLIAGDLYDGAVRSARTAAFLSGQMSRLQAADIPVFYIKGNHDAENPMTGEVTLPGNVHVFDGGGGCVQLGDHAVWVHGVSFSGRSAPDSLLGKFRPRVENAVNIGMLHTSLAGASAHDNYAPCSIAELTALEFDYWALGHVHKRQVHAEMPWIVMPGIPQGRHVNEAGPKSATLLHIDDGAITVSEVATGAIAFDRCEIDTSECGDEDDLRAAVRANLRRAAGTLSVDAAILRVRLTGAFPQHWRVARDRDRWTAEIADIARETGRLWVEDVELAFTTRQDDRAGGNTGASAVAELASIMSALCAQDPFDEGLNRVVADVLNALPPRVRADLLPDEDAQAALTTQLARDGVRRMEDLMRGADT